MSWATQRGWRWCNKCQGLWFGPREAESTCPQGGRHSATGSGNYSLVQSANPTPPNHQGLRRWCNRCQGLWFGPRMAESTCPEGGRHSTTGSGSYFLANQIGAGQAGWRWCNKCQGLWFGPREAESNCPKGGRHSAVGSGNYRLPIVTTSVRVHAKILTAPDVPVERLFHNMREVYATANVDVVWASTETLNLPSLNIVDVGDCPNSPDPTTNEQDALFSNRNFAGASDIVVYFVAATNPPYNGCAAFAPGRPAAVCVRTATQWTFAHEIGHVLDLRHVNDNNRLMTGNGTGNITNPPPDLIASEATTMRASPLTANV